MAEQPILHPSSPEQPPAMWTIKDVARFLARSERWVARALRRLDTDPGSLPHYRLPGGAPRFDPTEVEAWFRGGCPPAATFRSWAMKAS